MLDSTTRSSKPIATFVLVHGTFANKADWPHLEAALTQAATDKGKTARFLRLTWSGRNSIRARREAATRIRDTVNRLNDDDDVFLVGHSHGGSAIAYALKDDPRLASKLHGCLFISTPFIAVRQRVRALHTLGASFLFLFMCLQSVVLGTSIKQANHQSASWLEYIASVGPSAIWKTTLLLVIFLWTYRWLIVTSEEPTELVRCAYGHQTSDLPPGNYCFLRCSGDEAAAALSAIQFFAWASTKSSRFLLRFISLFHSKQRLNEALLFSLFGLAVGTLLPNARHIFELAIVLPIAIVSASDIETGVIILIATIVCVLSFAFVISIMISLFVLLAQAGLLVAFGWSSILAGFLVDVAIEPTPFGDHKLIHVDWNLTRDEGDRLTHSGGYSSPAAVEYIKGWVSFTL